MRPLDRQLRNKLESTVKEARDVAEAAAAAVIEQLGVGVRAAYPHLSDEEKELRRKLRIHGKQLGDRRDSKSTNPTVGEQETACLVEEVAYEHWHRMLFARFLAENNLLMYPDETDPVSVTLEECEDLAADEGAANGWELASRFAARMLPQIFRPDSPVFELKLPPEHQQKLERLLGDLSPEVLHASDSLGWVYQFWQAKRKAQVNASEVKIGARELPAVTQLFTEPYMVAFLFDNTLGAWWAGKRLSKDDLANAQSEEELRKKTSLPGVPLAYLRFIQGEDGKWMPAAGTFEGWSHKLNELKVLDPCCGSGHFIVAAFHMLVPMRMEMDGLTEQEAVDAVLGENLHGLEIDQRCTEIAAFGIALAAWSRTGYRQLPELQIACTGVAPQATQEQWMELASKALDSEPSLPREPIKNGLVNLHRLFSQAPTLGSLIDPIELPSDLITADHETMEPLLAELLRLETDVEIHERVVAARDMAKAAQLLAADYDLVITNVPYCTSGDWDSTMSTYINAHFPDGRTDLATAFLLRCWDLMKKGGHGALVLPQSWLFQPTYSRLRKRLLRHSQLRLINRLGPRAFETISGEVVNVLLLDFSDSYIPGNPISVVDSSLARTPVDKATASRTGTLRTIWQDAQMANPGHSILVSESSTGSVFLGEHVNSIQGIKTGDDPRYKRRFWELRSNANDWILLQSTVASTREFGGLEQLVYWGREGAHLARKQGMTAWGRPGVAVSQMSNLPCAFYLGQAFDSNVSVLVTKDGVDPSALYNYAFSDQLARDVRMIDQSIKPTNSTFEKVQYDPDHWQTHGPYRGLAHRPPLFASDATQHCYHGHPTDSDRPLMTAVARLLGYRWPAELDEAMELSNEARELAKRCDELLPLADKDGIVCIPAVRGEASAADRLHNLLAKAYGDAWCTDKLNELLKQADHGDRTLETWLRDKFFVQHCQVFGQRPFIWHIWDGLRDGFSALVNYHKLDHKNLETLIYTYLGDWISRQKRDRDSGVDGAEEKLDAAEALKKRLELILEGEAPYDIFVRWKPIEEQPVGWQPDLNDGVRLNIRPFISVPDVRKKGAGVLREKLRIHWKKDGGKNVESAPWYNLGPKYDGKKGDRINDHHLTLDEKRKARKAVGSEE